MDQPSDSPPSARRSSGRSLPPFTRQAPPRPATAPPRGTRPFFTPSGVPLRDPVQRYSGTAQSPLHPASSQAAPEAVEPLEDSPQAPNAPEPGFEISGASGASFGLPDLEFAREAAAAPQHDFDVPAVFPPSGTLPPQTSQQTGAFPLHLAEDAEPATLDELFASLGAAPSGDARPSEESPAANWEVPTAYSSANLRNTDLPTEDPGAADLATADLPPDLPVDLTTSALPVADPPAADLPAADLPTDLPVGDLPNGQLPATDSRAADANAVDLTTSDLPAADLPARDLAIADPPTADPPPADPPPSFDGTPPPPFAARFSAGGSQMIVDFDDAVGGAPEASFETEGLTPQSLGPDVFESLAPWGVPPEDVQYAEDGTESQSDRPVGFPTPSIFLQTIAAHLEANRGEAAGTSEAGQGSDAQPRQPVPAASALRQIVETHVAVGGEGAAIAAALERVAERVRRGEIRLPNVAPDGEAAALALALTALLQPGRD